MIEAMLENRSWLQRSFTVNTAECQYKLEYRGRGIGWEGIAVDDVVVARGRSIVWFVPRFDFQFGEHFGTVEVRVWPWLAIRSFRLSVDSVLLYEE